MGISGHVNTFKFDYDIVFGKDSQSHSGYFINYEGLKIEDSDFRCHYSIGEHPELPFQLPTKGERHW
ncbi:hypothetical protein CSA56_03170, partial [candidate division KSB3 bacterium]